MQFSHIKKQMMQCMNACIKSMDKITETPDVNGLITLNIRDYTVFKNQIKVNSNEQSTMF